MSNQKSGLSTDSLKQRVWNFLEHPKTLPAYLVQAFIIVLIIVTGVEYLIEHLNPVYFSAHREFFHNLEFFIVAVFTVEYFLKFWSAQSRIRFFFSVYGVIDLLAIVPFYLIIFNGSFQTTTLLFRMLRFARILRLLKLVEYIPQTAQKIILENIIKNIFIILILVPTYFVIRKEFLTVESIETIQTLILFVGLILVAPLFAVFQFTYEYTNLKSHTQIIAYHLTTFLGILVVGLTMSMIDILFVIMVGKLYVFRITLVLFYITMVSYDFWGYWKQGLRKIEKEKVKLKTRN